MKGKKRSKCSYQLLISPPLFLDTFNLLRTVGVALHHLFDRIRVVLAHVIFLYE